jgi:hypothetical protein
MPLVIKPRTLAFVAKAERRKVGASYIVSAMGSFDLARPHADHFETGQTLWLLASKALPPGAALDARMPKPRAFIEIPLGPERSFGGPGHSDIAGANLEKTLLAVDTHAA